MAKAKTITSTPDQIWLREALNLASPALGSERLAKELLVEWMAAGKLPWSCLSWQAPRAQWIAMLEQLNSQLKFRRLPVASPADYQGDPQFWRTPDLIVDWKENEARDSALGGARASGIRLSRTHLLTLLPEQPREPEQGHGAGAWIANEVGQMKAANEIPADIRITQLAQQLERRMRKAAATNESIRPITWRSIKNRLPLWGLWPITRVK